MKPDGKSRYQPWFFSFALALFHSLAFYYYANKTKLSWMSHEFTTRKVSQLKAMGLDKENKGRLFKSFSMLSFREKLFFQTCKGSLIIMENVLRTFGFAYEQVPQTRLLIVCLLRVLQMQL